MDQVGIRELRQHASTYIDRVKNGESLEVTERGIAVAVLSPTSKPSLYDRLVAEGRLVPGRQHWSDFFEEHPLVGPVTTAGSDALEEQRRESR